MLGMLISAHAASPFGSATGRCAVAPACKMNGIEAIAPKSGKQVQARKLNEMPGADAYLAVLRSKGRLQQAGDNRLDIGRGPNRRR